MRPVVRSSICLWLMCLAIISVRAQTITSISPTTDSARDPAFTLTVDGANFETGSIVRWNGNDRPTTLVSSERLLASIPATDIATPGVDSVTVFNPGSGASNALTFTIIGRVVSVSAASFIFHGPLAPESQVAAFGSRLATSIQIATTIPRPTSLGGTTVRVRDSAGVERLAPLDFVAPTQVDYQMPPGTAVGMATPSSGIRLAN